MFLNIRELELRKVRFDEDFSTGEIDFDPDIHQVGVLNASGIAELLNNTLGEIRVRGRVKAEFELACDRCLEPVRYPMDREFDLFYRPAPAKGDTPHDLEIDEGEAEIGFYQGLGLELSEVVREHVLLSLPMQKVCAEGCRGICPVCGRNRNSGACSCTSAMVADRWAALREWKTGTKN